MNESKAKAALAAFILAGKADSKTNSKFSNGELRYDNRVDYARKDIGGLSGRVSLISEEISKADGTVSIHQGRLPETVYACYDSVLATFESTGAASKAANAEELYSPDLNTFDDAVRNGILFMKQDDNVLLELPISVLGSYADSDGNAQNSAFQLAAPVIFEPGKEIEWEIKVPNAVDNTSSTSHNVEITAFGVATRPRG